jgi:hypothetical protein
MSLDKLGADDKRINRTVGWGFEIYIFFNLAMLARHGWRMLQNPDSLCCTVLKALYFPDCSILEAKPQPSMSYTW